MQNSCRKYFVHLKIILRFMLKKVIFTTWIENQEQKLERQRRFSARAGLTVGSHAYSILYRGPPYSDFTMDILLAAKGGAVTRDLNHSKRFVDNFRNSCSSILQRKLKQYLSSPLLCTGRRPPVAFSCDKMTEKRRSGQMTAIATIFSNSKVSPDEMIQTFFVGNPVVRKHNGLAKLVADELLKIIDKEIITTQFVSGGTDGQYFNLGVPDELWRLLNLNKIFFYWDPAHKGMLAEKDIRTAKIGNTENDQLPFLVKLIETIKDFLSNAKYGNKYEHLIQTSEKYPNEKFCKLHSIITTRFAAYMHSVLLAVLKGLKVLLKV